MSKEHNPLKDIGHVVGIESHDETLTDLQIMPLLTLGKADKSARDTAIRGSDGEITAYMDSYKAFQRDYRKKYSAKFLDNLGYSSSTGGTWKILIGSGVLPYVQTHDGSAHSIISMDDIEATKEQYARWYMQQTYDSGWSNSNDRLTHTGRIYDYSSISQVAAAIAITLQRRYAETIVENLTSNYGYDGTYVKYATGSNTVDITGTAQATTAAVDVTVHSSDGALVQSKTFDTSSVKDWGFTSDAYGNGTYEVVVKEDTLEVSRYDVYINNVENWTVGAISGTAHDNVGVPSYLTTATRSGSSKSIYTAIEYITCTTTDLMKEVLYVEYTRSGSSEWYVYLEDASTIPDSTYIMKAVDMTVILPLKEDNVIVDLGERKLKRMLRKLNVNPESLVESLEEPKIDDTYIVNAMWPMETNASVVKALYMTFDLYETGSVVTTMNGVTSKTRFVLTKTSHSGQALATGTYSTAVSGAGETTVLTLTWQSSASNYSVIEVSEYTQTYSVNGHGVTSFLDGGDKYNRVLLPLTVQNALKYRDFVDVYELSLCMLAYSIETVHVKWYETGAFGTLLKIVAIVLVIVSLGTLWEVGVAAWALEGTAMAVIQAVGTVILEGMAVGLAVQYVLNALGPKLGVIAVIVAVVVMAYTQTGGMYNSSAATSFTAYLPAANTIVSAMDQALGMKVEMLAKDMAEFNASAEARDNLLEDAMNGLRELNADHALIMNFDDTQASSQPNSMMSPDTYIALMQGQMAVNWDQYYDVDSEIGKRTHAELRSA